MESGVVASKMQFVKVLLDAAMALKFSTNSTYCFSRSSSSTCQILCLIKSKILGVPRLSTSIPPGDTCFDPICPTTDAVQSTPGSPLDLNEKNLPVVSQQPYILSG